MSIEKLDFETIEHENIPYILIHRQVIQEISDPFAGFIWVYLHSLPSDWKISKAQLKKHFAIGDDKLKKHLAHLNKVNLIEYVRQRNEKGELVKISIRVLDGTKFNNQASGVKTTPVVPSTGVKTHPLDNPPGGFYPPLTYRNKEKEIAERGFHVYP